MAPMHSHVASVFVYNPHITIFSRVYSYVTRVQARRRGGSKGSNEPPLKFDNGGLKYK